MKEHICVESKFKWESRGHESRTPTLWLARNGGELYFVNESDEILDFVNADSGGFITFDDGVAPVSNKTGYSYIDVKPNEAVKIEEYDGYYDLDYVLQVVMQVKSENLGNIEILSPSQKGGVEETVLLWDSGDTGNNVSIDIVS